MRYSIITINYNNCRGLTNTIESVVSQTYYEYEFIVIDGGSTDGSVDVIKKYADNISFWISETDKGIYNAMNKGVIHAHGDYCIFMNSGDCFYNSEVLERFTDIDEDIIVGLVSIDEFDHIISPAPQRELTLYHLYSGAIPHQGSFIRTTLLRRYPYDESLKISADWKFFLQTLIMDNCSVRYIDHYVANYDLGGVSSQNPELMRQEREKILHSFFPPRIIEDYKRMKASECLTNTLTPQLRNNYCIDKILYVIGKFMLKLRRN